MLLDVISSNKPAPSNKTFCIASNSISLSSISCKNSIKDNYKMHSTFQCIFRVQVHHDQRKPLF